MSPVRAILTVAIASFSLAALLGIAALFGGDFGETQGRVLLTTLVVGCTSMAVLCLLGTAGTRWRWVGLLGGVVTAVPTVTALVMIWGSGDMLSDGVVKTFFVGLVLALTLAQLSLLLVLVDRAVPWLLWSTVVVAVALALVVSGQILAADTSGALLRLDGVLGILDVLGTVVTVGIARFGRSEPAPPAPPSPATGSVQVPPALASALAERAAATGRPAQDLLVEALERYLAREESV